MPRRAAPVLRSWAPLGARLSGATATVTGHLYDSLHSALPSVDMEWWSWSDSAQTWSYGQLTSQVDGSYSAAPVAPTTEGEIWAYPDADTTWARTGQSWTAGSTYPNTDLYPGRVTVSATRDGVWNEFYGLTLNLWGDDAFTYAWKTTGDTGTSPGTVQPEVMSGTYDVGSVNFWLDEGVEFTPSPALTVASGSSPSDTIYVSEGGAQRLEIPSYKYSGKPGITTTVNRFNFPAGWSNYVTGYGDPSGTAAKVYGIKTSNGGAKEALSVKIPGTAKPGYSYWIGFQHRLANGDFQPLYLETPFQVCTMKASKTSITKSTRIRVTGIVPTQDHWKSQLGIRKKVVAIWHKGTATPATKRGWYLMASTRCTGTGAYTSPYFKVPATGTLAVYYYEDNWYRDGFTTPVRITVR